MYPSIAGIYRNGRVELTEPLKQMRDETNVIVTFLNENAVDLRVQDIDEAQAAELRARLASFVEEWNAPEMDVYDDYDAARPAR